MAVNSQEFQTNHPEVILPLLNEFRNEARKQDVYIDGAISKHLGAVRIVDGPTMDRLVKKTPLLPYAVLSREVRKGIYGYVFIYPVIYIQENVLEYPEGLRWVAFHEIGHFLGLDHSDGIMTKEVDITRTYSESEWNSLVQDHFTKIKALPENSYWKKIDNTMCN